MTNWRIMIVDDEEDLRHLIGTTLRMNFEVVEAHDGLDALEKIERFQPDFIIMDVMMPLLNGLDTSVAIRENPNFNHVPILFLSALSTREHMQQAYRSGADLYLTKPIDPNRLLNTVEAFLKKHPIPPMKKKLSIEEIEKGISSAPPPSPKPSGSTAEHAPARFKEEDTAQKKVRDVVDHLFQPQTRPNPYDLIASQVIPRVMVVDDDYDMIDFLRLCLQDKFEVVCAVDGISAIQKLIHYQPDLFILDVMLPKMSGYQLCQSIRRNITFRSAPVLMISAKTTRKDEEYALRLGADAYLRKPFTMQNLQANVCEVIKKRKMVPSAKKLSIGEIMAKEQGETEKSAEAQEERILKKQEESEIQRFIREELEKEAEKQHPKSGK